jgi:tRNA pseudouridine38-40 synthase
MKFSRSYLLEIQFLGFRFSGWQKQINAKTIHDIVDKSLSFVIIKDAYKTIGMSRTDAKVSANKYFVQLFVNKKIEEETFIKSLNNNFPQDFKIIGIKNVLTNFNIINAAKIKEYHYYFSFGEKAHPFSATLLTSLSEQLDIELMKKGAKLFEGKHHFNKYCTKPSKETILERSLDSCEIIENTTLTASFFPKKSYVLKIRGKGFLRYQIRLIMATLFELGKGNIDLLYIKESLLQNNDKKPLKNIAPASGLQLYDVELDLN